MIEVPVVSENIAIQCCYWSCQAGKYKYAHGNHNGTSSTSGWWRQPDRLQSRTCKWYSQSHNSALANSRRQPRE